MPRVQGVLLASRETADPQDTAFRNTRTDQPLPPSTRIQAGLPSALAGLETAKKVLWNNVASRGCSGISTFHGVQVS